MCSVITKGFGEEIGDLVPWPDTKDRLIKIQELCSQPSLVPSHEVLQELLSDRSIGPAGILRHESPVKGPTSPDTLFHISVNCTKRRAQVKEGFPDGNGFVHTLEF